MSLELFRLKKNRPSAHHHIDTADGVGVLLHVTWAVLTTDGTTIS